MRIIRQYSVILYASIVFLLQRIAQTLPFNAQLLGAN